MSKIRTTRKHIRNMFENVYSTGYANLQYIFDRSDATYYNYGVYGWNWDGYTDYETDTCITTGYRNTIGKRVPAELINKYTDKAKAIRAEFEGRYTEMRDALDANKEDFFRELVATV